MLPAEHYQTDTKASDNHVKSPNKLFRKDFSDVFVDFWLSEKWVKDAKGHK